MAVKLGVRSLKMRRILFLVPLVVLNLAACGGGEPKDPLIDALPGLMPTEDEVRSYLLERPDDPLTIDSAYQTNEELPISEDGQFRRPSTEEDLYNRGRVTGYSANYLLGETDTLRGVVGGVRVSIDLFEDDEQASVEVARLPDRAYVADVDSNIGDESLAWSFGLWTAPEGVVPRCACEFRFRVGRMVAYVDMWYNRPYFYDPVEYGADFNPVELELADALADRLRGAQGL
jgi:hypothetical protein